jgi:hypothetical protein
MILEEAQRNRVAGWVAEGLKLSEIQTRMASELGIRMTYMDVRLLVDDLKLTPKDPEPSKPNPASALDSPSNHGPIPEIPKPAAEPPPREGGVSVNVDRIARAGSVVSGKVTFSDGQQADWYFDQTGRLGLGPQQQGYRPSPADLQEFQRALESELARLGL